MPTRETPSYSSTRVQRASRLNALETARLQQRLMLLEKARTHQLRLTNQDIRITSLALEYILNCSGHSSEGRGPEGQQGGAEAVGTQEEPFFMYGERVASRKVGRRMARPHSAVERSSYQRQQSVGSHDADSVVSGEDSVAHGRKSLPPRPQSSPAKGRSWSGWVRPADEDERGGGGGSGGSDFDSDSRPQSRSNTMTPGPSRPSTAGSGMGMRGGAPGWGRTTPHQAWEDDTDEITKRLIKAQQQHQQMEKVREKENAKRRSRRYMQDLARKKAASSRPFSRASSRGPSPTPTPRASSPAGPVIEDKKPISPAEKHGQRGLGSAGPGRRAGLTEIMSHARTTMSAGAWRSHLASTQIVPRSAESQRQFILEAKKEAERQRQHHVMQRVETFMGQLPNGRDHES